MGLFDRLLKTNENSTNSASTQGKSNEKPQEYFLDADAACSLGNVGYRRESKQIRHTFPGSLDNPGLKEEIKTVAAESLRLEKRSDGLGGAVKREESINITKGVPKPVSKTFAQKVSSAEMKERLKGLVVSGVNTKLSSTSAPVARKESLKPKLEAPINSFGKVPTGSIEPFRQMVRELKN